MRISLLTYGSRGDVEPFLALGSALQARGHTVRLAAPERFAAAVARHKLACTPLPGDIAALSKALVDRAGNNPLAMMGEMSRFALPLAVEVIRAVRAACDDADLIVHTFMMTSAGHIAAQERGVPQISAQLFPIFTPTAAYSSLLLPLPGRSPINLFSHHLSTAVFRQSSALLYHWLRRRDPQIGPPRLGWCGPGTQTPLLLAYSPTVVPPDPRWGPLRVTTGYWHHNGSDYRPSAALETFLSAGPPPIYLGFGSMITADAARLASALREGIDRSGRRAIVQRGWLELDTTAAPHIFVLDEAPHDWLFPRMAGIIHHGGAGTTGAALRSGVPSLVIPFGADQPFWGRRVFGLGVGPAPIPLRALTGERLAAAIQAMDDPKVRARAAQVAAQLRREDGTGAAIRVIEHVYEGKRGHEQRHTTGDPGFGR